tara:strand:- start:3154 stop:3633 length:480 start_codon:yes stop_codon:yes gene_type:complete
VHYLWEREEKQMDIERLKEEIKADEGYKNEIYLDHLSLKTLGVGHLIKETDPEYNLEVGTYIDDERVNELFEQDLNITLDECTLLYDDFYTLPEEAQLIIANMMFNMGRPRLSRFHKMKRAVDNLEWQEAAFQMEDSKWYKQVTNRAERLCKRMRDIST